jgi:hypothetical protein
LFGQLSAIDFGVGEISKFMIQIILVPRNFGIL